MGLIKASQRRERLRQGEEPAFVCSAWPRRVRGVVQLGNRWQRRGVGSKGDKCPMQASASGLPGLSHLLSRKDG